MKEPIWLRAVQIRILHAETLQLFGGRPGLRDNNLLESALARPRHLFSYKEGTDLPSLAAEYAFGLVRNHPFVDGNKRVALLSVRTFLYLNGFTFIPAQAETVTLFEKLASGDVDRPALASWIRKNAYPAE